VSVLNEYKDKYRNVLFERRDGVLQMSLHTEGGPMMWGAIEGGVHEQLGHAFYDVGHDVENRVLILTGTGNSFCVERNPKEYGSKQDSAYWYRMIKEGKNLLMQFLDVEIPVIAVINGPATIHPEIPALGDVVLASEDAVLQDSHLRQGVVPGDGGHVVWEHLLGPNRSRYFLYTEQIMTAQEAKAAGVIGEILPREQLLPRAWEIAMRLAKKPLQTLHYTRTILTQPIKQKMLSDLGYGWAVEALSVIAMTETAAKR
jgi:enoyl-CoA hydratase/carnithine racemase